jgi:pimeloyl-ACP methyl ester carboxylesterase
MKGELQVFHRENGAAVAFSEYGDPRGLPVFFCHGWPSSRSMAELTDEAAGQLGLRIISVDRPGIRDSQLDPNRTLLDWPPLMRELAAHLRIDKFKILAISGGAPYAFVAAHLMPECVEAIAVVSGAPPIADLEDRDGLLKLYNRLLALRAARPGLLRVLFHVARPFARIRLPVRIRPLLLKVLQPCDANVLRDSKSFEACFESARQAWSSSAEGVMIDADIYANRWGFALEEVRVPVRLWHGKKDRTFSYRLAEQLAARLPDCEFHLVEGAGHYSLPIRHTREILQDLIR